MSDTTILIVNYNAGGLLGRCLDSLASDPDAHECPVIVVDNASTDGSADAAEGRPRVLLVRLPENRGFGAANNAGLAKCRTPFVLMVNPDTEIASGSLTRFVQSMRRNPVVGLAGCRLLSPDGSLQFSARALPTVGGEFFEALFLHRFLRRANSRFSQTVLDPNQYESPRSVGWVSGAVMLARVKALEDIGRFDEGFFLYAEEIDLCKRLHVAGWDVRYDPALTMLHVGGAFITNAALAVENQRSKLRYFLKHEGRAGMAGYAVALVLRLLVRTAAWSIANRKRPDEMLAKRASAARATLRKLPSLAAELLLSPRPGVVDGHLRISKGEAV